MIHSFAEWLQALSVFLQAFMTLGVMVLTLGYVFVTKKLLDRNHGSFIIITSAVSDVKGITAIAENHGSSVALNMSVIVSFADKRKKSSLTLLGPNIIPPGEKAVFRAKESKKGSRGMTIRIRYRSQTRPEKTEVWSISKQGTITFIGREWGIIAFLSWLRS